MEPMMDTCPPSTLAPQRTRILESEPIPGAAEAAAYDAMVRRHYWLLNRSFVQQASRFDREQARVLDIGTGPGWVPIELARQHPGWEIWALDPSTDMLLRAGRHAVDAGVAGRVHLIPGSAENLPFPNESFDLVLSHFTLHHVDRPVELLNEAARVVIAGGRVLIKDLVRQPPWKAALRLAVERYLLRNNPFQVQMSRESVRAALTVAEVQAIIRESSLGPARVRRGWGPYYTIVVDK
jgi:ubiquinone/menaquinone biosynthesis C-methylase UbiE